MDPRALLRRRRQRTGRIAAASLALLAVLAFVAAACGSDSSSGNSSKDTPTTPIPESVKLPLSQVRAMLPGVVEKGNAAAAALAQNDAAKAKAEAHEMHEAWEKVEGTVKDKDPDAYISLEDAQTRIENAVEEGKAQEARAGAKDQADLVQTFLKKHPA